MRILLLIALLPNLSYAQGEQEEVFYGSEMTPRGGDQEWGVGVYLVPTGENIPIYEKNTYELSGYLIRTKGRGSYTMLYDQNGRELEQIYEHGIVYIGSFELSFLQVEEHTETNGFYLINWKSSDHAYLIKKSDLNELGAKFYTYRDLITSSFLPEEIRENKSWASIGINVTKSCLNLRKSPSIYGEKIDCIPGNDWGNETQTRLKIIEVLGNWAKVDVKLLQLDRERISEGDFGDSYPYKLERKLKGWVKFIDENGFPNLWFSLTNM